MTTALLTKDYYCYWLFSRKQVTVLNAFFHLDAMPIAAKRRLSWNGTWCHDEYSLISTNLEYCITTHRICCLLFKVAFWRLSLLCRLQNLRTPFKIPFSLVPPIVVMIHAFFYLGTIRCLSWNGTWCHTEDFFITERLNTPVFDLIKMQISQ